MKTINKRIENIFHRLYMRSKGRKKFDFHGMSFFVIAGMLLLFFSTPSCFAQLESGTILGFVTDSTGAVVPSAAVTITNEETSSTVHLTADSNGKFDAPTLPLGSYTIAASAPGFKTSTYLHIRLEVGQRINETIKLNPGAVSQNVTVTAATPLLQTASSSLGEVITNKQVEQLPLNGRSIANVLEVVPGVKTLSTFSINGSTTDWFNPGIHFLLDGADASQVDSDFVGAAYNSAQRITRASLDGIQEIQILTGNFSAEYGQSSGALINIITKSGTNSLHGSMFEYNQNSAFTARDYFDPVPLIKPSVSINQFGGSLGGPIVKNTLFFFTNYEGIRQSNGVTIPAYVPTAAFRATLSPVLQSYISQMPLPNGPTSPVEPRLGLYTLSTVNTLTENAASIKVDYQVTPKDRLTGRWNPNWSDTADYFGVSQGEIRDVPGLLQTGQAAYSRIFTPNLFNDASVNLNRMRYFDYDSNIPSIRNEPAVLAIGSGGASFGPALFNVPVANTSFTYLDTLSWVKGKNQIKTGLQIIRNMQNKGLSNEDYMVFLTLDQFAANKPFEVGTVGYPVTGIRLTYMDLFIQDDIQASRHLALNVGLRYQYDSAPTEAHNRLANYDPATGGLFPPGTPIMTTPKLDFDPRFGFAYSPFNRGRTVIRGAFGLFTTDINVANAQELLDNYYGNNRTEYNFQNPNLIGFPFPNIPQLFPPNIYGMPVNGWRNSYTEQWSLDVQQALGSKMALDVGYIGNHYVLQAPLVDVNRVIIGTTARPNPKFGSIDIYTPVAGGNYNGLQVSLKRQMSNRLSFNVNYTYAHALNDGGSIFGGEVQNDHNWPGEYGNANSDIRHYLEFNYLYQLPAAPGVPHWLGGGWQLNGITAMRTGLPINVICGCDSVGIGEGTERANVVPGVPLQPSHKNVPLGPQINMAAFSTPPQYTFGDAQRNLLHGPGAVNFDASLFKNFKGYKNGVINFRAEAFNVFNHPNFANPGAALSAPATFGQSFSTSTIMRALQLAVRYDF
jgi:hypothetical protein